MSDPKKFNQDINDNWPSPIACQCTDESYGDMTEEDWEDLYDDRNYEGFGG